MQAPAKTTPKAQYYSLKTPLVSKGVVTQTVAENENLRVWMKVYAEGGENFVHKHMNEDHTFIVLDGEATFPDEEGNARFCRKWEAVFLPKGAYYSFTSPGDTPLVMVRVGAGHMPNGYKDGRQWLPGES